MDDGGGCSHVKLKDTWENSIPASRFCLEPETALKTESLKKQIIWLYHLHKTQIFRKRFLGSKITMDSECSREIKRHLLLERKAMTNLDSVLKCRHHFADKGLYSQIYGFSNSHARFWEVDHQEGRAPNNWCFRIMVPEEKTPESPLDSKSVLEEINPEYSLEGLMLKLKLQYFTTWCKEPTHWKRLDAGKDWGQEEK